MATAKDPICGKEVDTLRARAVGIFGGVTYYFCSADCKAKFKDPRKAPRPEPVPAPEKKKRPEARKDPSLEELPPMKEESDEGPLPDLTPEPIVAPSPSVEMELAGMKSGSRTWAAIIVVLAALIVATVLFLR